MQRCEAEGHRRAQVQVRELRRAGVLVAPGAYHYILHYNGIAPGAPQRILSGAWGTYSLYRGFSGLTDTLPPDRCERRGCFLRRLVVSWAACYTAVSPIMIYTVWQALQ